jgi:hypothetical protein
MNYQKAMAILAETCRERGAQVVNLCLENTNMIDIWAREYDTIVSYTALPTTRFIVEWQELGKSYKWCIDPDSTYGGWWEVSTDRSEISGCLEVSRLFGRTVVIGYDGVASLPQRIYDSITKNLPNLI